MLSEPASNDPAVRHTFSHKYEELMNGDVTVTLLQYLYESRCLCCVSLYGEAVRHTLVLLPLVCQSVIGSPPLSYYTLFLYLYMYVYLCIFMQLFVFFLSHKLLTCTI